MMRKKRHAQIERIPHEKGKQQHQQNENVLQNALIPYICSLKQMNGKTLCYSDCIDILSGCVYMDGCFIYDYFDFPAFGRARVQNSKLGQCLVVTKTKSWNLHIGVKFNR